MKNVTYHELLTNFADTLEQVSQGCPPVIITREGATSVVLMSLERYRSMEETAYLLQSPSNALRLLQSVDELSETH